MGRLQLICGDDEFAVKERARAAAAALGGAAPEENPALETVPGDSDELKPDAVIGRFLDALRTPPFLCDSKLVWLRHCRDLDGMFSAKEPSPGAAEALSLLTSPLPPEVSVLIDGGPCDQRKGFFKAMKNAGAEIEVLNAARAGDRRAAENRQYSIRELAREFGKEIAPEAARFLGETLGGDSGALYHELEKICCYAGEAPKVTLSDCQAVCSRTPETVGWEFTGAIAERNPARALSLLDILLRQGEPEMRLLAMLSGEFQKQIQTRLALRQLGIGRVTPRTFDSVPDDIRERYPQNPLLKMHPYRAFKTCEAAMKFSDAELAAHLERIRDAARALVSGGGDRRIVLEQLVLALTRSRR